MTDHNLLIAAIRDERETFQQGPPQREYPLWAIMKSLEVIFDIDEDAAVEAGKAEALLNSLERLAVRDKARHE